MPVGKVVIYSGRRLLRSRSTFDIQLAFHFLQAERDLYPAKARLAKAIPVTMWPASRWLFTSRIKSPQPSQCLLAASLFSVVGVVERGFKNTSVSVTDDVKSPYCPCKRLQVTKPAASSWVALAPVHARTLAHSPTCQKSVKRPTRKSFRFSMLGW